MLRFTASHLPNSAIAGSIVRAMVLVAALLLSTGAQSESTPEINISVGGGDLALISVSGSGIETDPVTIVERLDSLAESTLVIRYDPKVRKGTHRTTVRPSMYLAFTIVVTNGTGRAWSGFRLDLQAEPGKPSTYFDGLSFDQPGLFPERPAASDHFETVRRNIEPFDGIHYYRGGVNPDQTVRFFFNITDMNLKREFYLVQQPEFLSAGLQERSSR